MKTGSKKKPTKSFSSTSSNSWKIGGAIFICAFAVRIIFLSQLQSIPFFRHLFSDSQIYFNLSKQILDGRMPPRAFFMSPLYPYVIAAVHLIFGNEFLWVRLIQCMLGSAAAVLAFRIGEIIFNRSSGIISGILYAVYSLFIFYDNAILIESIQTFAFVLLIWLILHAYDSGIKWWWISAGAVSGILIVLRANALLTIVALAVYFIVRAGKQTSSLRKNVVWFSLAGILMIVPWAIKNYTLEGRVIFITSSAGFNFYAGNNERAAGEFTMRPEIDISVDPNGHHYVERNIGRQLSSSEVSSYWFDQSLNWMRSNPVKYVQLLSKKFLLFWTAEEIDQLGLHPEFIKKEYATIFNVPFPGFLVVAVLGITGIFLSYARKHDHVYVTMLVLCLITYMISVILFFVSGRLRVPITPILILFAGSSITELYDYFQKKNWRVISYAILVSLCTILIMTTLNIDTHQTFAEEYNRLGMIAFDEKKYPDAQEYFKKALTSAEITRIRLNLANAYAAGGQLSLADQSFQKVIETSPHSALAYFNFGNFALQVGNQKQAYLLWQKTIKEDSTFAPAYRNIAVLLSQAGKYREAVNRFEQCLRYETDPQHIAAIRLDIENMKQIIAAENQKPKQ